MSSMALAPKLMLDVETAATNETGPAQSGCAAYATLSAQVVWAGLTGSIGGTVKLQVSNTGAAGSYTDKSGASLVLSGASGASMIAVSNVAEEFYQAVWTKTGETAGTIVVTARATRR